jgi:hypothetical protein
VAGIGEPDCGRGTDLLAVVELLPIISREGRL